MNEAAGGGDSPPTPFRYHIELSPSQLKVTHTALHSLLDGLGHDEHEVLEIVQQVLAKLPDEHAIRAIRLGSEQAPHLEEETSSEDEGDGPPPVVA